MNSVSSFKGSLFVLLITGVTLIVSPLTSYAQNDGPPGRTRVAQVATVIIKWNDVHQTIDGFGTAQGGDFVPYLYNWPEPHRSQILDLAFSQANGIGLTILRSEIRPELEPSKGTWNYTDTEQVWLMKQAVNRGVTKLFASVWSPPAWMKTNGDVVCCYGDCNKDCVCVDDCAVKPENYQDFADFLSHYAAEYASANGVNIYAVSMTNEPDNKAAWRSCAWTSAQIASFLGDYLSPTFAANHIAAKVIAPETSRWDLEESYMKGTYNNPTATARLFGFRKI